MIKSGVGGWLNKEKIINRKKDLTELIHDKSYTFVLVYNATGIELSDEYCRWLEALFISMSWTDHRIWCNRIATLSASNGASASSAIAASNLAQDSKSYGVGTLKYIVPVLISAIDDDVEALVARSLRRYKGVPGYNRPIVNGDVRVYELVKLSKSLGLKVGKFQELAFNIEAVLIKKTGDKINLAAYTGAVMLDIGFNLGQMEIILSQLTAAGAMATYSDYQKRPLHSFKPLHKQSVVYIGHEPRKI